MRVCGEVRRCRARTRHTLEPLAWHWSHWRPPREEGSAPRALREGGSTPRAPLEREAGCSRRQAERGVVDGLLFGACEVRCWRWLFGNEIPVSLDGLRVRGEAPCGVGVEG